MVSTSPMPQQDSTASGQPKVEKQELTVQVPANSAELMGIEKVFETAKLAQTASSHNFGEDKFKSLGLISACKSGQVLKMEEMPADGIELQYYFVHVVQIRKRETSGLFPTIRTVLVSRNGDMYDSVSEYIARDMMQLIEVVGSDPIPEGFVVQFQKTKSGQNTVHKLVFKPAT